MQHMYMYTNMYDKCITAICMYMILSYIFICAAKVVVKAEPESDDEFSHIKVGKPATRQTKKTPRQTKKPPRKEEQEPSTTPKGGY